MSVVVNFISLWNGWHNRINGRLAKNRKPLIERYEVKEVLIETGRNADFHVDGELYNTGESEKYKDINNSEGCGFSRSRKFLS